MKNLITQIACILIFAIFLFQFIALEKQFQQIMIIDAAVANFADCCTIEGKISQANEQNLITTLNETLGLRADEISVTGTKSAVQRGQKVSYEIILPIKGIYGLYKLFGYTKESNKIIKTISGAVISEYTE